MYLKVQVKDEESLANLQTLIKAEVEKPSPKYHTRLHIIWLCLDAPTIALFGLLSFSFQSH